MKKKLKFDIFSGGTISIDTGKCAGCATKACVKNCRSSKKDPVLKIRHGIPDIDFTAEEIKKGACTECLACELDCQLYGKNAVSIELPRMQR